jgi:hypothetical protein
MSRATLVDQGLIYTVNVDDPRNRGRIFQSLALAQLMDDISEQPIQATVQVTTDLKAATARTATNGIAGLVGIPLRVFPRLDAFAADYHIEFAVEGFTPFREPVHVPIQPSFPTTFSDSDLGPIVMRRTPFALKGRTSALDPTNRPVACPGAQVALTGLWRHTDDVDIAAGPPAVPVAAIQPSLYAPRPIGAGIEIVAMPTVAEPPRVLIAEAGPGSTTVAVSQSVGLVAGDVIGFELADPERREYIEIKAVHASNDPSSPATLDLELAIKRRHAAEATVQKTNSPALGAPVATLVETAMPGDVTLFVNSVAPLGPTQLVRISGGTAVPEYASCLLYRAVSDPAGYYRFPELHRVAAICVQATRTLPAPAADSGPVLFNPNYALYHNGLDLVLT